MSGEQRAPALERLDVLVGVWTVEPDFPDQQRESAASGKLRVEWDLDRQFLVQRSEAPDPIPNSLSIISLDAKDADAYTQHYFDSRGVVRLYRMTFDGRTLTLERTKPDFSPFEFAQRYTATLDGGGSVLRGTWEICHDSTVMPESWEKDFDLVYTRIA